MNNKKLGFGLMRLPLTDQGDPRSIDMGALKEMVDLFIGSGYSYFDTAWMYHKHSSETAIREALTQRYPRDSYSLATKLHESYVKDGVTKDDIFYKQCEKTGVDYFDYYLIHSITDDAYESCVRKECFPWLLEKKKAGLVKHAGFSFHGTPPVLERILNDNPWVEFVQLQINYLDWDCKNIRSGECYRICESRGIPVIVMEPVKGGSLASLPARDEKLMKDYNPDASIASWAIRFVAGLPNVMMVLSGMSNPEQMKDNIATYDNLQPLNEEEKEILRKVVVNLRESGSIACTACAYCTEGCPVNINIPEYFRLYNAAREDMAGKRAEFSRLCKEFGKPSDCLECGQCENICPQGLPIMDDLKDVARFFE